VNNAIGSEDRHLRLPGYEFFDEIRLAADSRYKDSDVSGSEWRTGITIEFLFKGDVMATCGALDMQAAAAILAYRLLDNGGTELEVDIRKHAALERTCCDQPGCKKPWTWIAWLRRRYTNEAALIVITPPERFFRRFCDDHADRGDDAGYEDANNNYDMVRR
jgi:hypothetical protein